MKLDRVKVAFGAASVVLFGVLVACGGDDDDDVVPGTSSSGGSSGGDASVSSSSSSGGSSGASSGGSSSGGSRDCRIQDGTYAIDYTGVGDGGPGCPPPDSTFTYATPDAAPGDGGGLPAGCTTDTATCTTTCETTTQAGDFTIVSNSVTTVNADGTVSGSVDQSTNQPDGGVLNSCEYTYTWTKQ